MKLVLSAVFAFTCLGCAEESARDRNDAAVADAAVLPPDESVATPTENLAAGVIDSLPGDEAGTGATAIIPAALHGRWGISESACAGERDYPQGVLTINGGSIILHNAIARPARIYGSDPNRLHGEFAFSTPDGRSWTGPMIWSVEGRQLVRIDSEGDSRMSYVRC